MLWFLTMKLRKTCIVATACGGLLLGFVCRGLSGAVIVDAAGRDLQEIAANYPQQRIYLIGSDVKDPLPWNMKRVDSIKPTKVHRKFLRNWTKWITSFQPGPIFERVNRDFIIYDVVNRYRLSNVTIDRGKGVTQSLQNWKALEPKLDRLVADSSAWVELEDVEM